MIEIISVLLIGTSIVSNSVCIFITENKYAKGLSLGGLIIMSILLQDILR